MDRGSFSLPDGLSERQAAAAAAEGGTNALSRRRGAGFFRLFLDELGNPIVKILLLALALNLLLLFRGEGWFETVGIALAAFLASFLSALSEYGSERAFARLQAEAAQTSCRVRRGGQTREVPVSALVRGDWVLLGAGDAVPADGVLRRGALSADQSALNGESEEAEKRADPSLVPERWPVEHPSLLFRGSAVSAGVGAMEVLRVGDDTLLGSMAQSLQEQPPPSPLKSRLEGLAQRISRLGYLAAAAVAAADLFSRLHAMTGLAPSLVLAALSDLPTVLGLLLHAATLAIGVVIVAVPEGLPMMITVVLSRCMGRMARDGVMVRRLTGIETAGSLNILFTDKTGTLTEGRLAVEHLLCGDSSRLTGDDLQQNPALARAVGLCCTGLSGASWGAHGPLGGNATDRALLRFGHPLCPAPPRAEGLRPFDSTRKRAEGVLEGRRFATGAPERLLDECARFYDGEGTLWPLDRAALDRAWQRAAAEGRRVLALCAAEGEDGPLALLGLAVVRDGLRPETRAAVRAIRGAGVQLVMVTGDSAQTAAAIARDAGLLHEGGLVLTSAELGEMTDRELQRALPRLRVLARALPTDKKRLVRAAQQLGLVAGMTGDGVNDAPALKLADVGFAMGSGTQVARDAGDIVILSDDLAAIGRAILYGRTIFCSIRRFLVFQLTMNLCAVAVSLLGPFLGVDAPVTVIQMLWINLIMDTLAGLAFAGEPPREALMREAPKARDCPVLTAAMAREVLGLAGYMTALCILFLRLPAFAALFDPSHFLTAFFALFVFAGIFSAFSAREEGVAVRSLRHNPTFLLVMGAAAAVQLALIYFGGPLFRTAGLGAGELLRVLCLASSVIPAGLLRKLLRQLPSARRGAIIRETTASPALRGDAANAPQGAKGAAG